MLAALYGKDSGPFVELPARTGAAAVDLRNNRT